MASFSVPAGTDWIQTFVFGYVYDRWELDEYKIWMQIRVGAGTPVLVECTPGNGRLVIVDSRKLKLEVNVEKEMIDALDVGRFEFDFYFENRATGICERSPNTGSPHILNIVEGITFPADGNSPDGNSP